MLFNSPTYLFLFLPVAVIIYFLLNRARLTTIGKAWLVLASLFFYGYWNTDYLLLIIGSILVNFAIGEALHRTKKPESQHKPKRKSILTAGIVLNLALLGYYKYADFFISNINLALESHLPLLELALPLAISFFTFQQIAYLVDSYQTDTQEYDFLNYCLFVTFFPQLIAGPIVHHREMMPQFMRAKNALVYWPNIAQGLFIFSLGLFKKIVIADSFAEWANAGFNHTADLTTLEAWATSLSYTFQLYYDFSGYSDMAIGAALLFNIRLPINFNSPYKAVSIQDFWRRWHITLSNWLRDYLYIPLGGNRSGDAKIYLNLFLTFLLGGLWHGAGWTFIIWGAMHGLALAAHRFWQRMGLKMHRLLGWACTFLFVNAAWVVFRADTLESAERIYRGMLGLNGFRLSEKYADRFDALLTWANIKADIVDKDMMIATDALNYLLIFGFVAVALPNSIQVGQKLSGHKIPIGYAALAFATLATALYHLLYTNNRITEFLYFNF